MITRIEWARALLKHLGCPTSHDNEVALVAWQAAEGSPQGAQATYNPLNTTRNTGRLGLPLKGTTTFNSVGVRNYRNLSQGLRATKLTLLEHGHGYEDIVEALRNGHRAHEALAAVEASAWGTGGLAASIIDDVRRFWEFYSEAAIGQ